MRTLSSTSRALCVAAAIVAAALILGGAYFVGYVGEIQRDLKDPASLRRQAATEIAALEKSLGYAGFLKAYRNYRLTGDSASRPQLTQNANEAARAIATLRQIYAGDRTAGEALSEAAAVTDTFAHIARIAPQLGDAALRGSAGMETLNALPQAPQLEATYLSLRSALDRLRQADIEHQLGGAAAALNWSQALIIGALALVVLGLIIVAALLQLGIIQPLKSLEHSLASVGDGAIGQRIWGTERTDEFGALARAGEKVRHGLAETSALKAMADKGQLRLTLDGNASVLFEKLVADVSTATDALKTASAGIVRQQDDNRRQFEKTVEKLAQSGSGFHAAAKALNTEAASAVNDIRASNAKLADAADNRVAQLDRIATRFDENGRALEQAIAAATDRTTAAVGEFSASNVALQRVVADAQSIQGTFSAACEKISSDAANTTGNVRTLAARLGDAVGSVDQRLTQKLSGLDNLEQHLTQILAKLNERAGDTVAALKSASSALDERGVAAETRMTQTIAEFEEVLRLFRDDEAALHQSSAQTVLEMRAAQRTMGDTAETQSQLAAAIARLDAIAAQLERPVTATPVAEAPQVAALTKALQDQGESIRNEIRDLAVRLTEDRLLAGADMPFLTSKAAPDQNAPRQMTLADVPGAEIMSRLQNLAAEMNAAQSRLDHAQSLKDALGSFATEVKTLAANADRSARMRNMGKALEHHADEIETHAKAVEPSSGALRNEIHAITSELRTVAARAQSNNVKDASTLREAAIDLGARAESLFSYFENAPSLAADDDDDELAPQTADAAAADLQALAQLIGRIEARAEHLSQAAVAARFAPISDDTSPAEREAGLRQVEQATDGAVHAVFASIERLNNIAAALARAGEIERRRHAAH
ncbi:MAG: hypothetical protein SGI91_21910 [Alphaproteobacteria bacterium]|nr:hypothetical protein [Alphaproteobacteria bacterium]